MAEKPLLMVIKGAGNNFCAGLSAAVNGFWEVRDADQGAGVVGFSDKGDLWRKRRKLAKNFWAD